MKSISLILILYTILAIIYFSCSNPSTVPVQSSGTMNRFDRIENKLVAQLSDLELNRFNDSAKWLMYLIHVDDTTPPMVRGIKLKEKPFGSLNLKLGYFSKKADTLDLLYNFIYDDSIIVDKSNKQTKVIASGVQYDIISHKVLGYLMGDGVYNNFGSTSRYSIPLQQEVISFIGDNKEVLNPWLVSEASRRGVIK